MSQESDHERIRRLIQERMEQGERPKAERLPPVNLDAAINGGLRLLAFALFRQAFVEAMVEQRERDAGIVPGDPNTPVSWDGLEALLGKEQVDRFRRGRTSLKENPRMADEIDLTNDRILRDTDREVARIVEAAARIPPGEPGDCDLCGEWSGRLVGGVCAPCRDRYQLP